MWVFKILTKFKYEHASLVSFKQYERPSTLSVSILL